MNSSKILPERWVLAGGRADFSALAQATGISPITARLLVNRGVKTPEQINKFLNASWQDEYNPCLMKGAKKAAELLLDSIHCGKKILIASDFDVDGIFSGQILLESIRECGGVTAVQAPDREKDGYGINAGMVERAKQEGFETIITCDNGIAAFDALHRAKELGLTVIVTDHHACQYDETGAIRLPEADVIVNPHQPDCAYPFKGLCGAGVVYKVVQILYAYCGFSREDTLKYLEYAAMATVADVMDLVDENRIFVKEGLVMLTHSTNPGIKALKKQCGLENLRITSYHIGFVLGPCFNAAGRLDTVDIAFRMLSGDEATAEKLAAQLYELNEERKLLTTEGVLQAIEYVEAMETMDDILVIPLPSCHPSVAGIVAGKVRETYNHPVIVLTKTSDGWKGSGRSIEAWDMFEGLSKCRKLMSKFGGHPMAAGLSVPDGNLGELRRAVNTDTGLKPEDFMPVVRIDVPMPLQYISEALIHELDRLEPFGKGNPKPLFAENYFELTNGRVLGKNRNAIRMTIKNRAGCEMSAIYFCDAESFIDDIRRDFGEQALEDLMTGRSNPVHLGLVYYPEINMWRDQVSLQVMIKHIKKAQN